MYRDYRSRRALSYAQTQWNGLAFSQQRTGLTELVKPYFKAGQIVLIDNDIIVTDIGYVIMAIHSEQVVRFCNFLVIPGVDSKGRCGHLVLSKNSCPYHSYASTATAAYCEAKESMHKAQLLLSAFGSKSAMHEAVAAAPWYTLVTSQDYQRTGLCQWGADSFMRRYGLRRIAYRVGLPKVILQMAGVYGERLVAARLVRNGNTDSHPESASGKRSQRAY